MTVPDIAAVTDVAPPRNQRRNIALLSLSQAVMMSSSSLFIVTAALVGELLAPRPELATLPVALQFVGVMMSTVPASYLMRVVGRRGGFLTGLAAATTGATLAVIGLSSGSFITFCVGAFLFGTFNAFGQYYRFAAAECAAPAFRSRAISLVLAGGVAAAFVGPNLASVSRELLAVPFAGSYAMLFVVYAIGLLALLGLRVPVRLGPSVGGSQRRLAEIIRQPAFFVAVLGGVGAWTSMNFVMTATSLAVVHHGHDFSDAAFVIQWHVLAMFAPSFVTGSLIRRFGVVGVMLSGSLLLATAIAVNLSGASLAHFWAGLVLLGLGWNLLFVGATDLLTRSHMTAETAKVQGLNEFLIFSSVAVSALASGAVESQYGWATVNLLPVPLVIATLVANLWLLRRHGRAAPAVAT